jgi:porin
MTDGVPPVKEGFVFHKKDTEEWIMTHTHNAKTLVCMIVTSLAAISVVASSALGQVTNAPPADPDPMAAFKTDKGLISLTKVAPEMTPVSDYTGDFWNRATLFGDPGGWRSRLYDQGITLDAQLTQVFQGVVSGGSAKGKGHGQYNGLFEATLTFDTAKLGLWSGGLFILTEQTSFGDPLKSQAGSLSPVNQTALWPRSYEDSSELMEYHLIQALPFNTVAIVGRLDPSNYLDQNSFACTSDSQFLNVSMNSNPLFGRFLTYSTYAALLMTKVTDDLTLAYGAWTPNTAPGDYGGDWNDFGAAVYPIFKYKVFNRPGMISAIAAYTSKDAVDVGNPRFVPGVITGNPPTKTDNWIVELSGEQYFWQPEGASVPKAEGGRKEEFHVPTKDFAAAQPGIGIFYRFSYTPEDRSAYDIYLSGGVGGRGVIPGRPYDRFGVGAYWLKESSDFKKQPIIATALQDEVGVEAFYNLAITPWLQLTLDAQWISPGIQSSDNAWVLGTRLNTRF